MKIHQLFLIAMVATLASCSARFSYFTKDLYEKQNWTQDDIRKIQFYVSKDIVLTRSIETGESIIAGGKIRIKDGRRVEQVVIKAGTPGIVVLMPKEDRFAISFEDNDESYLMFGPNPKYYDRFALLAQDWKRADGKVHYNGKVYEVDAESAYSTLMVDLRREGDSQYQTRKVQGRVVK